jgi:hypothetical protein
MTAQINVLKGDAKHEIVKLSKELGADMIIIGSRGLGAVKRLTMGSVSDCKYLLMCISILNAIDTLFQTVCTMLNAQWWLFAKLHWK